MIIRKDKKLIKAFHFHSLTLTCSPFLRSCEILRPQPDDAKTTHVPTPPAPAIPAGCRSAPRRRRRRRLRRAATGARASPEEADSALCRRAEWVRRARLAGAGDGQLAGVLGLRRAARVGGARRGRHRGADAAGAQPGARALLHLRRPQHPAPLRRRQGPPRRACGFFRLLGVSPSIWITNCGFPCRLSRCCWRKVLTLTRATTAAR